MISREILTNIRTIVTHANCPDGIASALILRDALPDAKVIFVQHGTPEHRELPATEGTLFCDIVPVESRVAEFVAAGAVVLDHHRGARDVVAQFGDRGVFADENDEPGVSGAMLAFREVWARDALRTFGGYAPIVGDFAALTGIRDTWQRSSPRWREACAQAAALRFLPWESLAGESPASLMTGNRLAVGEVLLRLDEERDTRSIAEGYAFTVAHGGGGAIRCVAFEGAYTSDVSDRLADSCDLVLGWHHKIDSTGVMQMVVSCRARGGFSALALAKAHGGGGHTQAAGFTIDLVPESPNPWMLLRGLVERFVAGQ